MRIRRILTGLVILVVGAAAAIFAIVNSIDFNAYKDLVTQQVKAATGRDLVLAGDVKVALSLTPRLEVDQVSFRNADWGSEPEMAKLDKLEADVDLIPLLSSQIRIKRLHLIGADILLETDAKGQGNWIMGSGNAGSGTAPLPQLDEATIENSHIRFKDGTTGKLRSIAVDRLTVSPADTQGMLAVDFSGRVDDMPLAIKGVTGSLQSFVQGPLPIDATGQIAGNDLGLKGQIAQPAALEGINLELYLAGSSTEQLAALAGIDAPKLGAVQLRTKLTEEGGKYLFDGIAAKLGGSDLTGKVTLDRTQAPPSIDAALASSHLDLADFGIAADAKASAPSDGRVFSATPWDFSALRAIDGHVRINVQQLIAGKTTFDNVVGELGLKSGLLKVTSVTANLGDGSIGLAANVNSMENPAAVQARFRANNVDGVPLMAAMGLDGAVTAGRVNLEAQLEGPGTSLRDLMAKSNGGIHLEMGEGAIKNDFARLMFADLFQLVTFGGTGDAAHVDCAVTDLVAVDGIANTRSMVLDTPGVTIVGSGDINLRDETLHLRFDSNSKQVNLANLAVPLNVGGTLSHPSVSPDALGAVGDTANFAARAANTATFGVLNSLTGVGGSNASANPCVDAAAAGAKAKQSSATDKIINGLGTAGQGVSQGAQELGQGAVDATKKAGQDAGQMLNNLGNDLGGMLGN
ncbi:MAG TPA: AsmA family protein [Dongiaceae bacterium]|nr:AsmA family protein [Dongiaceae bacterium]